jgi:large subunit ribosomal protein L4
VDNFELPEIKTKSFVEVMRNFHVDKALIITHDKLLNLEKSSKNLQWAKVMRHEGLNVYDILRYNFLFLEQPAVRAIEERLVS